MVRSRVTLAVVLLTLVAASASAATWTRVDTPNFIIIGATGKSALQDIGRQFEGFREALTKVLSSAITATPVPTVVVVFSDDKTFEPFKPVYEGKTVDIGGLFISRRNINYILLGPNRNVENLRPVFHEYSHLVVSNVAPKLPVWMNEGLAEYYSTFEMNGSGRSVIFGRAVPGHYYELANNRWIPLDALLSINDDSPEYNENSKRGVFYAESWLLMHMLLHGEPDRRQMFAAYARELAGGTAAAAAWQHQFGNEDIFTALRRYAQRPMIYAREYKLPERISGAAGVASPLTPADAENTLGEVLLAVQRLEPAKQRFDRALALQPSSTRAVIGKAKISGTPPRVTAPPDQASDWIGDYVVGAALIEERDLDRASLDVARAALARAAAARGDIPNVQVLFAMANERAEADGVIEALKKAYAAAPVRDDYAVYLARAMARAGDFAGARSLLGGVMARPFLPGGADIARGAMGEVVTAEERAHRGVSPLEALPADHPADDADTPASTPAKPAEVRPVFREVGAGEQRVEGRLQRIDCSPNRIEFIVDVGDRVAHFLSTGLDKVEFITYRSDLEGAVECGARNPTDPVYVTWRAGELDGTVVAIEFVPVH